MQENEHGLSKSMYHATKWSAITNLIRKIISPVTNMILARLLAPEAFGVVATINMVVSFAEMFSDAGFNKYLVQHEFEKDENISKVANVAFWTNFCISVALWGIIAFLRHPIAMLVGSEGYGSHLMVAAFSIPLISFSSIQQSIYRRNFDFKGLFLPRLINSLVPLVVTIPLAYLTRDCWALIIGTLITNIIDAILLTVKSKWKPQIEYSVAELRKMFSFSMWTMLESLAIWLTINIDIFLLGQFLSKYYLGLYKVSITTVDQIVTLITATVIPVLFSGLSRCQKNKKLFEDTFYKFQRNVSFILIPMSVGIFVYREVITWILLGEQWMEASFFIGIVGLMQAFTVIYANFASEVYRAMGEPKISLLIQILYIICIIPGVVLGVKGGFEILCITRGTLMVLFVMLHMIMLKIRYKFSVKRMLKNIRAPLCASVIMGGVGIVANCCLESMLLRMASMGICIGVYFVISFIMPETRAVMNEISKRR